MRVLAELRSLGEILALPYVIAVAALVPLLVRLPLTTLDRVLRRRVRRAIGDRGLAPERLAAVVSVAQQVAAPVVRSGCLTRGVTLYWLLQRSQPDVELRFGLDLAEDAVDGHCWIVLHGAPFLERVDPRARFLEQHRFPAAAADR